MSKSIHGHILKGVGFAVAGIFIVVIFLSLFGYVTMLLWNWLMPILFGLKAITYVQAIGILLLSKLLLGGFKGHNYGFKKFHKHVGRFHGHDCCNDDDHDEVREHKDYDAWWQSKGKKSFEAYISKE